MASRGWRSTIEVRIAVPILVAFWGVDAAPLAAQSLETPATYRALDLAADFWPDPEAVSVVAGGPDTAIGIGNRCTGFIYQAAADIELTLTDDLGELFISAASTADTTLVVHAPDDTWHCSDDEVGVDPLVVLTSAEPGPYHIWVGTIEPDSASAVVFLSQVDPREGSRPAADEGHFGSGFFVSTSGHIVTNAHVVEGCDSITAIDHGPAELLVHDERVDLALLRVEGYAGAAAAFRADPPELGSDILLFGFPLADLLDGLSLTTGVVSSLSGLHGDRHTFLFTAPLQQGNSGGPLLDSHGLVVGVAEGKLDEIVEIGRSGSMPQNMNFAIQGVDVVAFLARNGVTAKRENGDAPLPRNELAARGAAVTLLLDCAA